MLAMGSSRSSIINKAIPHSSFTPVGERLERFDNGNMMLEGSKHCTLQEEE
jgi:hypothetical protein